MPRNPPLYACNVCGRTFRQKFSGQRHINNVEDGKAILLSYPAYIVGTKTGIYSPPSPRPIYGRSLVENLANKYYEELARQAAIWNFQRNSMTRTLIFKMIYDGLGRANKKQKELDIRAEQIEAQINDEVSRIQQNASSWTTSPQDTGNDALSEQY